MEINDEKFSLIKFFSGFGQSGKVMFILSLFTIFSIAKDWMIPKIGRQVKNQNIETYVEAPENKALNFFGIKIMKVGLGVVVERD